MLLTTCSYFSSIRIRCKLTLTLPRNLSFCSQQRPQRRITHVSSTNIKTPISISSESSQLEHYYEGNVPKRIAKVQVPHGMSKSSIYNRVSPILISHYHCHHHWAVFVYCFIWPFPVFPFLCLTSVSFTLLRQRFQCHNPISISYQFWFSQSLYGHSVTTSICYMFLTWHLWHSQGYFSFVFLSKIRSGSYFTFIH